MTASPQVKRVGITGSGGLIGWHLRCFLRTQPGVEAIACDRAQFADDGYLRDFVDRCDAIVHLAGINRGDDAELAVTNVALARRLVEAADATSSRPHLVYSSTTHVERDTPYGRSKKEAGDLLREWAERTGASCTVLVLPHVFGEGGRPFYNSVVSTFCHQLANDLEPTVQGNGQLELLHAQDVAREVHHAIRHGSTGVHRVQGEPLTVLELLGRLKFMAGSYRKAVVPALDRWLDLRLFNTYRSYLFPGHYPIRYTEHRDPRGSLFECVRTRHGGQCFVSTTHPGVTRGNHFHFRKFERFAVIGGDAVIRLRRLFDDLVHEFPVSGDEPVCIDMPTLHTHSIENIGTREVVTLFWSHEFFDPADPDTFQEPVKQ